MLFVGISLIVLLLYSVLKKKISFDVLLFGFLFIFILGIDKKYFSWFVLVLITIVLTLLIPLINKKHLSKGKRNSADLMAFWCSTAIFYLLSNYNHNAATLGYFGCLGYIIFDVMSSEITLMESNHYLVFPYFKRVKRGISGAISINGLLSGLLGLIIFCLISYIFHGDLVSIISLLIVCSFVNLLESVSHEIRNVYNIIWMKNRITNAFYALFSGIILYLFVVLKK